MKLARRLAVCEIVGLLMGAAVGLALKLNFDRVSREGYYLDRAIEPQWYKVVAAIVVCIIVGVCVVVKGHPDAATAGSFSFLVGLLVVVGWKLAIGRVVGANLWMIGLPMFAIPAAVTLEVCLWMAKQFADRTTRASVS